MYTKRLILLYGIIFTYYISSAQYINVESLTTREGLSQNDVTSIIQDSQGFIWFGTHDGLNRFDGKFFKKYFKGENNGLISGLITKIIEDHTGNLWIATMDNGISRLNLKTGKIEEHYNTTTPNQLIGNDISDIICDSAGVIWYATRNGIGKIQFRNNYSQIKNIITYPSPELILAKFSFDQNNRLWICGNKFLGYIQNDSVISLPKFNKDTYKKVFNYSGRFWLVSQKQLWDVGKTDFSDTIKLMANFPQTLIRDIKIDYLGNLWIGTKNGLFKFKYNHSTKTLLQDSKFNSEKKRLGLDNIDVRSLFFDNTGILFIGTYGDGVKILNRNGRQFKHFLSHNKGLAGKIRCVYQASNNKIYLGDHTGKIFIIDSISLDLNKLYGDTVKINTSAICLHEIITNKNQRAIVVGGEYNQPLTIVDGDKIELPKLNSNVFSIQQGKDGLVWIGTYGSGLYRFDPSGILPLQNYKKTPLPNSITSNIIRSLCFDSEERLWVGTDNGISILTKEEQKKSEPSFIRIQHQDNDPQSLSHNYILSITLTSNKDIWIATMGEGLNRLLAFNEKGPSFFKRYNTNNGLSNNVIRSVLEDNEGMLWISSNHGISKLNPFTEKVTNFDLNKGLQDYEFSDLAACRINDGMLIFGGVNGINAFYPNKIITDTSTSKPAFTNLKILNNSIYVGEKIDNRIILDRDINIVDEIILPFKNNSFSIQVAALNYGYSQNNYCQYKLEGFDPDWQETESGSWAKYTNLNPGKYTFKLKASNGDRIWTNDVKELIIIIKPPFALTNTMLVVYGLIFFILLMFFRKYSIIKIKRKHELKLAEIKKEKEKKLNQMKTLFFMSISHEFKTPLSLIINPIEQLLSPQNSKMTKDTFKKYHEIILRNAKILLRLVNQLLDIGKIEQGALKVYLKEQEIKSFLFKVYESFKPLADYNNINFKFTSHIEPKKLWTDYEKLGNILYNLLSNAFKNTPSNGKIKLELAENDNNYITIIVSDNGKGIPEEKQSEIFNLYFQADTEKATTGSGIGLAYSKKLVELLKGEIYFQSKPEEGTTFYIKLPKNKSVFKNSELVSIHNYQHQSISPSIPNDIVISHVNNINTENNPPKSNKPKATILVVEDNADLCTLLFEAFKAKYNIITAVNGVDGLAKCQKYKPDLIITDIQMPEMNGIEMTEKIKNSIETSHIPIIMLTAFSSEYEQIKSLNIGADIYIQKPFKINVLSAQIVSLLKNRQTLRTKFKRKFELQPSEISPSNKDEEFLKNILAFIEKNISNPDFTVQQLARHCGLSQPKLNNKLEALTGLKAKKFIRSMRIKRACQLLREGSLSISEVTYEVGFNNLRYFRECFTNEVGCVPSEYKNKFKKEGEDDAAFPKNEGNEHNDSL